MCGAAGQHDIDIWGGNQETDQNNEIHLSRIIFEAVNVQVTDEIMGALMKHCRSSELSYLHILRSGGVITTQNYVENASITSTNISISEIFARRGMNSMREKSWE